MINQILRDDKLIRRELCKIKYRGMKEMFPSPLPGMYEEGWIQKSGELILTNRRLLFIETRGCLTPSKPKVLISASLQGLSTSVFRFALSQDQLDVVFGSNSAQFGVSDPQKWADFIHSYSS